MSFFYKGKSPMDEIPVHEMTKYNQAQTTIRRYITNETLQRKKRRKKKDSQHHHLHRNIGTQRWNFIRADSEQSIDPTAGKGVDNTSMNSSDGNTRVLHKKSFRKKKHPKTIIQLKQERIKKNETMFKEIESSIRDQIKDDDLDSAIAILKDQRFASSNRDVTSLLAKRLDDQADKRINETVGVESFRQKDNKGKKEPAISANNEKQPSSIPSLPNLYQGKSSNKKATSSKDRRSNISHLDNLEEESDDPFHDLFNRDTDFVTDDMIPAYQTIHPLELEMKETIDFPSDLLEGDEELYIEDSDYIDYKKRLTEGYDSDSDHEKLVAEELDEKAKYRQKAHNFTAMWFLPPSQWTSNATDEKKKKKDKQLHSEQVLNQQLQDLSSSKLFKSFLVKSNASVPNWLKNVNVSKNQMEHEKSAAVIPAIIKSLHNDSVVL
ncbi:hypothetical protein C9374_009092 [Naegleria lovaniensis]|uniref:Uncharacterized protein n=1 Tax=Naegleria lovaniensis TaxID=51637 RepID=A0AA88KGX2_NAELO|nr:uncharacterized protein C9374_009092 [Naegleria lovaniensis]KAG2377576.1 hypothetical protein C9374_009092 [Naegleria lovaniensis]